ncbi:MAG: ribosome small subunit-dependent GTPase A [Clostridia bacterium]|nr:ribosome small subunit-dependent GTPase A [Clostridia bacterium]
MTKIDGIVVKKNADKFTVKNGKDFYTISARGNLKKQGVFVGDRVEIDGNVVLKVLPRKNFLIRPNIANIDQIIIVIASKPATDFLLIDKLIMYADKNNIKTIICVNKYEISEELFVTIKTQYSQVVEKIIKTSAINNQIDELKPILKDKISVFAGQSAVGKSTLLNAIFEKEIAQIGGLSKIERGRNTTRETELFILNENSYIADTPGFSCLELINFSPEEVSNGYREFYDLSVECKYKQCDHIFVDEVDCMVKQQINQNDKLKERYNRYKDLYIETREIWRKRYGK